MALEEYRRKRDFTRTPEPSGEAAPRRRRRAVAERPDWHSLPRGRRFCVQMHRATRMHLDFRIEWNGVLLSWAIPRGPSLDPAHKRLAVQTEDHPVDYGEFEGVIPSGYGMGTVELWDIGTYEWVRESAEDPDRQIAKGDIKFRLEGTKLSGEFALVRIGERGRRYGGSSDGEKNFLLIKKRDASVVEGYDALEHDVSVKTGRSLDAIAAAEGGDPREQARAARRAASAPRAQRAAPSEVPRKAAPAAALPAARELPRPMLAVPVDRPFSRDGWLFELKYDGVRAIAAVADGEVRLVGRRGRDETARYPEARELAARLRGHSAILDCEIVVLDDDGRSDFERLQSRINVEGAAAVRRAAERCPVTLAVFDILALDGRDLTKTELRIRKKTLHDVLEPGGAVLYADHVERDGESLFGQVRERGLEGVIAKRADSPYCPGERSRDWLKIKAWQTQSCVIAGWTEGHGRRAHFGSLVLGVMHEGKLVHAGQVGTGFSEQTVRMLLERLEPMKRKDCPLVETPRLSEKVQWVDAALVCEVRHAGWTAAGVLRHPAYLGLRTELRPQDCLREQETPLELIPEAVDAPRVTPARRRGRRAAETPKAPVPRLEPTIDEALAELATLRPNASWEVAGRTLRLTHLDKQLWPEGITKRDLIAYLVRMSPYILPYLHDRALGTQVFPDGITGKRFWRKDIPQHAPEWIRTWSHKGDRGVTTYIVCEEPATLAWLGNAAVLDLHPWHSRVDAPDQPDWAVFDLDPFEPATFDDVRDIARMVKAALDHYGLRGLLKTSGQTGLQIYVPLRRGPAYDAVRDWVEQVGRAIGQVMPDRVSWEWEVARRTGRIRIDYTQNVQNKTLVAPYSPRPAPGAPVSVPLAWEELDDPDLRPDRWTMATIGERVARTGDLFLGVLDGDQSLPQ